MAPTPQESLLRNRLAHDIAELHEQPYPGITIHIQDGDAFQTACLILSPTGENPLHLTVEFGPKYPISPPSVTIQSGVLHPNVFGNFICASILNTKEGYTSAYTLKGICIQLLSFFSSENIEQLHGGGPINRKEWQQSQVPTGFPAFLGGSGSFPALPPGRIYKCQRCGFGVNGLPTATPDVQASTADDSTETDKTESDSKCHIEKLPMELLLVVCDHLDDKSLFLAAEAWNGFSETLKQYNVITTRGMQCFALKKGFKDTSLGIGVRVQGRKLESEFDLISQPAFYNLGIRHSVQGLQFEYWLPLPLSEVHWRRVRGNVHKSLDTLSARASISGDHVNVIYAFMNDITVQLSEEAKNIAGGQSLTTASYGPVSSKTAMSYVSEKAIENYFQLFHLLLCLATEQPKIVEDAKDKITAFVVGGKRDKTSVPNLGHLIVMNLIADMADRRVRINQAIIKEAVTRNVVWMLDERGRGLRELSFLETDKVSEYRLQNTFDASLTSLRLLMFGTLMNDTVAEIAATIDGKVTLAKIRDELYKYHGSPPQGMAAKLSKSVWELQSVSNFFDFMERMGVVNEGYRPTGASLTDFLRSCVTESMDKGESSLTRSLPPLLHSFFVSKFGECYYSDDAQKAFLSLRILLLS
jgi:ubiquitin-protein ligase